MKTTWILTKQWSLQWKNGGDGGKQQSRPLNNQVNRGVPPPAVGTLSGVFPGGLSCKSVDRILGKKNRPTDDERILEVSSDYPE